MNLKRQLLKKLREKCSLKKPEGNYKAEKINSAIKEENERVQFCREVTELCLREIRKHLKQFLSKAPFATYEMWIHELHPDNTLYGEIDHRFYLSNSDHRNIWNYSCSEHNISNGRVLIPASSYHYQEGQIVEINR